MSKAPLGATELMALRLVPDELWHAIEDLLQAVRVEADPGPRSSPRSSPLPRIR